MAATLAPTAPATDRRTARRVLWGLQIVIGLFLVIVSALPKFAGQKDAVETFVKIGWGEWFRYFTGAVELAGGIALLIPRLAGAAATGLIGVMIGAIIAQCTALDAPELSFLPAVFGVIFAVIAWNRRAETRALIRTVTRR
ncbi:DoxX family protein [Spirillospora sp. NPDC048911]|uniref:DoxX family protein n=1 Tax=Spirillospora sp. NPDC048911 TaxID=3364527 RepID=UPI00371B970E